MQTFIEIYHMVEDLQQFPYFHIFGLRVNLVNETWHLANPLARSFGIYQYAKNYQNILNSLL